MEIVIHGEDLQAGFWDVRLQELRLMEAGDVVVGPVEDEDGDSGGGAPGGLGDDFRELRDQGGRGVKADAAAAVGLGGFDFVWGFLFEYQSFEAAAVDGVVRGVGAVAAFEEVVDKC